MIKLTELEKQKVIDCVCYQAKKFEYDRIAYDKLCRAFGRYNEEYYEELEHAREMEEFYSNLGEKLKEVL